jgi:hypothetical protein
MTQGTIGEPCFINVELTEQGFRTLNSVPPGLGPEIKTSLGSLLAVASKQLLTRTTGRWLEKGADESVGRVIEIVQGWMSNG